MFWLVLSFILHVLIFKVDVLFAVLLCIILQVDGVNNLLRGADVVHCVSTKVEEFLWSQTVLFFTSTHKIFRRLIPLLHRPSRICPRGIKIVYDSYTGNIGGKKIYAGLVDRSFGFLGLWKPESNLKNGRCADECNQNQDMIKTVRLNKDGVMHHMFWSTRSILFWSWEGSEFQVITQSIIGRLNNQLPIHHRKLF